MLAGLSIPAAAIAELASLLRNSDDELGDAAGNDALADRLERALGDEVKLLALSRILYVLDDPPAELAELRGVLVREIEWRRREGLD